ncbi:hypothetical protein QUA56_29055 [Microcoleus sp. N3A4]|uniref:transposase n=1 Tax=Microcoleus sp. N3A4 TaxID=3055379 RepID=UPI002FCEB214
MPYSTNLTDSEWEIIEPLVNQILPLKKKTLPPNWTKIEILKGIARSTQNGCNWANLSRSVQKNKTISL